MHGGAPVGIRHFLATSCRRLLYIKDMDKLTGQLNAGLETSYWVRTIRGLWWLDASNYVYNFRISYQMYNA
jgi:hypothetical protein